MDQEIKKKWVAALRSKQYQQGYKRLRVGDRFCALGVLCDVVDPTKWQADVGHFRYSGNRLAPPAEMLDRIGLGAVVAKTVALDNDDGMTFDQIADEIERSL